MTTDSRQRLNLVGGTVALALTVLLGFAIAALVYVEVPTSNQNALLVLIGALTTNVTAIVAFFFSSNVGQRKDAETINTLASTAAKAQEALAPLTPTPTIPLSAGATVTVKADAPPQDPSLT